MAAVFDVRLNMRDFLDDQHSKPYSVEGVERGGEEKSVREISLGFGE